MHPRQRLPDRAAMLGAGPARPHAFQIGDDGGRPAGQFADDRTVVAIDWKRAAHALHRQMRIRPRKKGRSLRSTRFS
jgi:hypothetical protein